MRVGVRLAIDVGSVRAGVARSDAGGVLASPLATIRRGRGDLDVIAQLVARHGVTEVIVGLPTSLSGHEGRAAGDARRFAARLAARLAPVPVRLFDERFTTVTGDNALRQGGRDGRARRRLVDQAAAAVLLQAALDAERGMALPPGEIAAGPPGKVTP